MLSHLLHSSSLHLLPGTGSSSGSSSSKGSEIKGGTKVSFAEEEPAAEPEGGEKEGAEGGKEEEEEPIGNAVDPVWDDPEQKKMLHLLDITERTQRLAVEQHEFAEQRTTMRKVRNLLALMQRQDDLLKKLKPKVGKVADEAEEITKQMSSQQNGTQRISPKQAIEADREMFSRVAKADDGVAYLLKRVYAFQKRLVDRLDRDFLSSRVDPFDPTSAHKPKLLDLDARDEAYIAAADGSFSLARGAEDYGRV